MQLYNDDCLKAIPKILDNSIHLFLSDIPYGINFEKWDILHNNKNNALLKPVTSINNKNFKTRGKPINGWSKADKNIGLEYEIWCKKWSKLLFPKMVTGSSLFIFSSRRNLHRVINSFESNNFVLKDIISWKRKKFITKAQKLSNVLKKRKLSQEEKIWQGWRIGNLAPSWESIIFFTKPYKIGSTITDTILENKVGGLNMKECSINGKLPSNTLEFDLDKNEKKYHPTQKPIKLLEFLIKLTTIPNQVVLDSFMGSGSTGVACKNLNRKFIGIELDKDYFNIAKDRI